MQQNSEQFLIPGGMTSCTLDAHLGMFNQIVFTTDLFQPQVHDVGVYAYSSCQIK